MTRARLEPGEEVLAWTRVWISRDRRAGTVLAARLPCFAVLTNRRVLAWTTGFFSRRPRRQVIADRLDDLRVEAIGPKQPRSRLRVRAFALRALRFDFGHSDRSERFAAGLCEQVEDRRRGPVPPMALGQSRPDEPKEMPWRP
ncbi:MAG: hypothetical protein ACT4OX_03260 [Actinomycetota bacterium]